MATTIKHTSAQADGLAQLDSVFAQLRAKAQGAKEWSLEIVKDAKGAKLSLSITNDLIEMVKEQKAQEAKGQ